MLFSLIWLVTLRFKAKLGRLKHNAPALVGLFYFLWTAIGLLYSEETVTAERILVLKVPFGAWAILLGTSGLKKDSISAKVSTLFIYALMVACLLALLQACWHSLTGSAISNFESFKLLRYFNVPPHYFGMYLNFAYGMLLLWFVRQRYLFKRAWISVLGLAIILVMIILLAVRIQFIVFLMVNLTVVAISWKQWQKTRNWQLIAMPVLALLLGLAILPGPRNRIMDSFNELVSFREMVNNKQTNPRKFLWRDGMKVIRQHLIFGTGTGAEDAALHQYLSEEQAVFWNGQDTYTLAETNYNYHNAYLQHWASNGIVGLVLLLLLFYLPFYKAKPDAEAIVFLLVCGISFLTESMLQRQAGVLFFSFFYGVFFIIPQENSALERY